MPLAPKPSFAQKLLSPPLVFVVIAIIAMASAGGTVLFLGTRHSGEVVDAGESLAGHAEAAEEKKAADEKKKKNDELERKRLFA
jgi:hypothetical protein